MIETNPRQLGPINPREHLRIYLYLAPACIVALSAPLALHWWRMATFPRTTAVIESLSEAQRSRRGRTWTVTLAELSFTRTTPDGKALACRHAFEIGTPEEGYEIGDRLEIVPAKGTCQRAHVIGRAGTE